MAVKSVIDVEINDAKFKEFAGLFEKYRSAVKEMPSDWGAINKQLENTEGQFQVVLAAMMAQNQLANNTTKAEKEGENSLRKQSQYWKDMARSTRDVAGNIFRATESLLKWIGLTSVFSGLVGAGGLYGIDRMAAGVAAGRRSSQGIGASYGSQRAFAINYGNLVDPDSFLGAVSEAQTNWGKKAGFLGANMGPNDWKGDAADVGSNLLANIKRIVDASPLEGLDDIIKSRSLDQFITSQDARRLRAMNPDEFKEFQGNYSKDRTNLDRSKEDQFAWLRFSQQMDRAGDKLENVFVKGLVKLADPLASVSEGFIKVVEEIADSDLTKRFINQIAAGLEKFAVAINSGEFERSVKGFIKDVEEVADAMSKVVSVFSWFATGINDVYESAKWLFKNKIVMPTRNGAKTDSDVGPLSGYQYGLNPDIEKKLSSGDDQYGLPSGWLKSIYGAESSYGKNLVSSAGAVGPFQFMEGTAKQYGVRNRMNFDDSMHGAGKYSRYLLKKFGDPEMAIAAYNWGEGNVSKAVLSSQVFGGNWQDLAPEETRNHIGKVMGGISPTDLRALTGAVSRGTTVQISITNNTGANVTAQTAQVAQ